MPAEVRSGSRRRAVKGARVLSFSRDLSRFKRVQPLRVALSIETHPLSRRIILRSGKGEMWLHDRGFVDAPAGELVERPRQRRRRS